MEYIKSFPKYLINNGLIFEINRKVLHPIGLALVVDVDYKNRNKLSITGLVETEDREGFLYDSDGFKVGSEKYEKFLKKVGQERLDHRFAKYGFLEQDKEDV